MRSSRVRWGFYSSSENFLICVISTALALFFEELWGSCQFLQFLKTSKLLFFDLLFSSGVSSVFSRMDVGCVFESIFKNFTACQTRKCFTSESLLLGVSCFVENVSFLQFLINQSINQSISQSINQSIMYSDLAVTLDNLLSSNKV